MSVVDELLGPVRDVIEKGWRALGVRVDVRIGEADGFYDLDGKTVVLSRALLGPDLRHPLEADEPLGLDRWRRAAGSVLEAAALGALSEEVNEPPKTDWRWLGAAIDRVDRLVPELGLADRDLALAVRTGSPGTEPRAGVAAVRALGLEPAELLAGWPTAEQWLAAGRWVYDAVSGLRLPVPIDRPVGRELPAWSWSWVDLEPDPCGGQLTVEGGAVDDPWVPARSRHRTLACTTGAAGPVTLGEGGPIGSWELSSAAGFGQVFGGRGVQYGFAADGSMEVLLADSFVGPVQAIGMAKEVGTSGVVSGRWEVAGEHSVRLRGLDPGLLTLHGRTDGPFAVPAQGFGPAQWLRAMCVEPWRWKVDGDRLTLNGSVFGGSVEIRLDRQ